MRSLLLASTALFALGQSASAAVVNADPNFTLTIPVGGSETSGDKNVPAVGLSGVNAVVNNSGEIEQNSGKKGGYAITFGGDNPVLNNSGLVRSDDRALEHLDGVGMVINNSGQIFSKRQAVRAGVGRTGATLDNSGLIQAKKGRAVQFRAAGATVINSGTLRGGEEVVEAREDFTLQNRGLIALNGLDWNGSTWTNNGAEDDEDGVQFASGRVDNYGVILGTDDGIDADEGVIHNHASGVIIAAGPNDDASKGGIDVDAEFEPGVGDDRAAGKLTVINEGLIEGGRGIAFDTASTAAFELINSGVVRGRSGKAVDMAPGQGASKITLKDGGLFEGDVVFGAGDDLMTFEATSATGALGGVFDGMGGFDIADFSSLLDHTDLLSLALLGDVLTLEFNGLNGAASASFRNFERFRFRDGIYAYRDGAFTAAPVPLPAALPMLLAAIGGLMALRRR